MKKLIALLLCLLMVFALVACAAEKPAEEPAEKPAEEPAKEPAKEPAEEPAEEPATELVSDEFVGQYLVVGTWGGAYDECFNEAFIKPFNEMYGTDLHTEFLGAETTAQIKAQYEQGIPGYDVITGCGALDQLWETYLAGATVDVDYSRMPNAMANLVEGETRFECGVGLYVSTEIRAWNTNVYPDAEAFASVVDYYDVENFPGKRTLVSFSPTVCFMNAAMAYGLTNDPNFTKDDLYPLNEDGIYEMLNKLKDSDSIGKWWSSSAEIQQAISDGEVDCSIGFIGGTMDGIHGTEGWTYTMDNASMIADCCTIATNCRNEDLAYIFLDYLCTPEAQSRYTALRGNGYCPCAKGAVELMPEDLQEICAGNEKYKDMVVWCSVAEARENFLRQTEEYLEWQNS